MKAERLLAHYEQIADAPEAIGQLRRFILDLAVRGRLVPQDLNERSQAGFNSPSDPEAPYLLPCNWRWARIGDQLELLNGMAFKPTDWIGAGLRIVRIQNLNNRDAPFNCCDPVKARERSLIDDGSFLISWSGTPGTSFGAFIWGRGPAVLNQHIFRCDFKTTAFTAEYLRLAINGRLDEMIERAHGGAGLQHITKGKLESLLIALPSVAEQHRIVAKVDELMALCDRLEAARAEREATRVRLAASSFARLNAPDTETFQDDARFVVNALPILTTRPDQIKQLRPTILNLAMLGRLVPQDPKDEPASQLLKQIVKEKARLDAGRATRGRSAVGRERPDEFAFTPPSGWAVSTLGDIALKITDGTHQTPAYVESGIPFVSVKDFSAGQLSLSNTRFITPQEHRSLYQRCDPKRGDILIGRIGTLGRAVLIDTDIEFSLFVSVGLIRFSHESICPEFFRLLLNSPLVEGEFNRIKIGGGTHTNKLNLGDLQTVAMPLPPLSEQHRIVAKVDELMALCDQLEASLTDAACTRRRLLDALLAEAL